VVQRIAMIRLLDRLIGWGGNARAAHAAAVALVGLATLTRLALAPVIGEIDRFTTFFPAVLVAAIIGGTGPGVTALAVGAVTGWYLFVPPEWSFARRSGTEVVGLALFCVCGFVTVRLAAALRGAIERIRESEERFRTMLEALPHMAFVLRPNADIEYYNRRYV
jgi:K+-sensing histidine kinase KdpD